MKKFIDRLLFSLAIALFALFVDFMIIEWLFGCGETYVDAFGVRHQYECAFIRR